MITRDISIDDSGSGEMSCHDVTLTCTDCGQSFTFSRGDQEYHARKGYTNDPKRCPGCRITRRNEAEFGGGSCSMGARLLSRAVSAQCDNTTDVPFRAKADRPVYCSLAGCVVAHNPITKEFQASGDRPVYCSRCYRERAGRSGRRHY